MELKLSRKSLSKRRSFPFSLGSLVRVDNCRPFSFLLSLPISQSNVSYKYKNLQRPPPFNIPPEDRNRYYDFVDTPVNYRPSSPLIDRPKISRELESEIRYACKLLVLGIQRGKPVQESCEPVDVAGEDAKTDQTAKKDRVQADDVSTHTGSEESSKKEKHDSGVELEIEQPEAQPEKPANTAQGDNNNNTNAAPFLTLGEMADGLDISQFIHFDTTPDQSAASHGRSAERPLAVTAESSFSHMSIPPLLSTTGLASSISNNESQVDEPTSSDVLPSPLTPLDPSFPTDDAVFNFSPDATSFPCRVPSFSRPRGYSRSTRKQQSEDLTVKAREETQSISGLPDNYTAFPSQQLDLETDIRSEHHMARPHSAIELGASRRQDQGSKSVIINEDGIVHFMNAAEEAQRQIDLQRAVMEKMYTGIIGASSNDASMGRVSEDMQRKLYLQRTVMEKMTGIAKTKTVDCTKTPIGRASTDRNTLSAGYRPPSGNLEKKMSWSHPSPLRETYTRSQQNSALSPAVPLGPGGDGRRKRKSGLFAKLSALGLGKKKPSTTSSGGGNMTSWNPALAT